ncbi:MAG: hypothetical protein A2X05_05045 [Bacteroidetes bacterium GWE2_41_25]|nr:MAG: hypothetical protein A2X05_05045 [Bacteroidetes bacterium GWE2_41_25]HCU20184.1 hypothetical protein [Bacteroidales bacterium]
MNNKRKSNLLKLQIMLIKLWEWLRKKHFCDRVILITIGIASTGWFLLRVIPKPSRASYPCMRAVSPFMSGFVLYLLSLGGISIILKRLGKSLIRYNFLSSLFLVVLLFLFTGINITSDTSVTSAQTAQLTGPQDGPNVPVGTGRGVKPGLVIWAWNPEATNENCRNVVDNNDWFFTPENTDTEIVSKMVSDAVKKLGGSSDLKKSWNELFRQHNKTIHGKKKGYTAGEKIFIKINQGTSSWALSKEEQDNGYTVPKEIKPGQRRLRFNGATETSPYVVLELLRELVNYAGVKQEDIFVGDPIAHIFGHNYSVWHAEFPDVKYVDKFSGQFDRTLIKPSEIDLLYYSDKKLTDKLFDCIEQADYMINVASLKPHGSAGISLTSKNHFGTHARRSASHLHYSLIAPMWEESPRQVGKASNGGYKKYRVLVDLMGSRYLGQNTMLFVVDGLYGGGADETKGPVKYFMAPFNDDWSSSIFISQDQVALESVCYDFLRNEWNGKNKHNAANSVFEESPNMYGVDDHLHQAADSKNWPDGIIYDPDNSGNPIPSLGVHEHWNNPVMKQYSGNLGFKNGITLVSIPDTLVKGKN